MEKDLEYYLTEDYNDIPVYYCKNCLSLKIINLDEEDCYCDDCGSTAIETAHIDEWKKMYKDKYGKDFTEK